MIRVQLTCNGLILGFVICNELINLSQFITAKAIPRLPLSQAGVQTAFALVPLHSDAVVHMVYIDEALTPSPEIMHISL